MTETAKSRYDLTSFTPYKGHCWIADLPYGVPAGDGPGVRGSSALRLFEDGRELDLPNTDHTEICALGRGRYQHWGRTLMLSTSDGSDPRDNGRRYHLEFDGSMSIDTSSVGWRAVYALRIAENHVSNLASYGVDLRGKTLLEIGPGANFATQLLLTAVGAKVIVADRFLSPWQPDHLAIYRRVREAWPGEAPMLDRAIEQESLDGCLTMLSEPAEALTSLADGSVDLVISNAVLEHVCDLGGAMRELVRVTRPGGRHFHQVDFRDHNCFDRPLEHLLLSAEDFRPDLERATTQRGCQWRNSEVKAVLGDAGLVIDVDNGVSLVTEPYFAEFLPRLRASASAYANWPEDDLRIVGNYFVATRP